jgi:tRNA A37 methylthiotransferase MiaB
MGNHSIAVNLFAKALAIVPNYAEALCNSGAAFLSLGKLDEAVASYYKALAIKPDLVEGHNNLGSALRELGKLDEAVASYQRALAIKPDYVEALSNLGSTLTEKGQLDGAVEKFQKAVFAQPDSIELTVKFEAAMANKVDEFVLNICSSQDHTESLSANQLISKGVRYDTLNVNLLFCPFVEPITPPLGIASIKGYLEKNSAARVRCIDLNQKWHSMMAGGEQINEGPLRKGKESFKNDATISDLDQYNKASQEFADYLRKIHMYTQYSLCQDNSPIDSNVISFLKPFALDGNPDVVGFSILFNSQILCSLLLAEEIKKENAETVVVFGGAGMLHSGTQIIQNPYVDFVVYEAGEASFSALLNSIKAGKLDQAIPGVAYKKGGKCIKTNPIPANLNQGAYSDFSDHQLDEYFVDDVVIPILSSKGCFWRKCSFCEEGAINQYAEAAVSRVVDEIEHHYSTGLNYFQFVDEMITPKRLKLISQEIIRRKLRVFFYGTLRPSSDFDKETLELMFTAGFRYVIWGVESLNRRLLKLIRKGTSVKSILNTLELSKSAGIRNHIFLIIGYPSEKPDELFETMQTIYDNKKNIHQIHSGTFSLCRGTEIFLHPEKFDIEIKYAEHGHHEYFVKYKNGTTGQHAMKYYNYYLESFLGKLAVAPAFATQRGHALLYYARIPFVDHDTLRKEVPHPVPAKFGKL